MKHVPLTLVEPDDTTKAPEGRTPTRAIADAAARCWCCCVRCMEGRHCHLPPCFE